MSQVKILIEGYLSADSGGKTCPTITLVRDNHLNIIVDPGTTPTADTIIEALAKEGLTPDDINIVFLTHSHYDHFKNISIFSKAKLLDYWGLWDNDKLESAPEDLTSDIKIIKTPGHSEDNVTMLVKTEQGTVAICGDVYFKENLPEVDPYASDGAALARSRELIKSSADFIIPGHGQMFAVKKSA